MVRVRPLNDREKNEGAKSCVIFDEDSTHKIMLDAGKAGQKDFYFDFIVG